MSEIKDLTGERFGRLLVVNRVGSNRHGKALWLCKCDCGNEKVVLSGALLRKDAKRTLSCGCLRKDNLIAYNKETKKIHGLYGTRIHTVWKDMIYRCEKPTTNGYENYGGRGITVCGEWHDLNKFAEWAYSSGYNDEAKKGECTIDRIDVNGNYEPSNCRWVNALIQNANRRNTLQVDVKGKKTSFMLAVREAGVEYRAVYDRMKYYCSTFEDAVDAVRRKKDEGL